MKTKVFLVRHGETEWNRLGKFQGCKNIALSKKGVVQAQYLSERFNDNFNVCWLPPSYQHTFIHPYFYFIVL